MSRMMWMFGVASLIGCSAESDLGKDDTASSTAGEQCSNSVLTAYPASAATDAFYRADIEFRLAAPDAGASITLSDADGNLVTGTSSVDETRVVFTPDALLTPSTGYTATLTWSCDPYPVSWTTSDVGPSVDASELIGRSYTLNIGTGRFVEPEGVGDLVGGLIEFNMLVGVTDATNEMVLMTGAISSDVTSVEQDMCTTTIDFPEADFAENPFFEVSADILPLEVEGFDLGLEDVVLSGAIAPDFSRAEGVVLAGKIDTRPLVDMISPGGGDDAVCILLQTFGADCVDCSDGSGQYCLNLFVDSMVAEGRDADPIIPVTAEDVEANPDCADTTTGS